MLSISGPLICLRSVLHVCLFHFLGSLFGRSDNQVIDDTVPPATTLVGPRVDIILKKKSGVVISGAGVAIARSLSGLRKHYSNYSE